MSEKESKKDRCPDCFHTVEDLSKERPDLCRKRKNTFYCITCDMWFEPGDLKGIADAMPYEVPLADRTEEWEVEPADAQHVYLTVGDIRKIIEGKDDEAVILIWDGAEGQYVVYNNNIFVPSREVMISGQHVPVIIEMGV